MKGSGDVLDWCSKSISSPFDWGQQEKIFLWLVVDKSELGFPPLLDIEQTSFSNQFLRFLSADVSQDFQSFISSINKSRQWRLPVLHYSDLHVDRGCVLCWRTNKLFLLLRGASWRPQVRNTAEDKVGRGIGAGARTEIPVFALGLPEIPAYRLHVSGRKQKELFSCASFSLSLSENHQQVHQEKCSQIFADSKKSNLVWGSSCIANAF